MECSAYTGQKNSMKVPLFCSGIHSPLKTIVPLTFGKYWQCRFLYPAQICDVAFLHPVLNINVENVATYESTFLWEALNLT